MNLSIEKKTYDAIAQEIESDSSPVGIDAKKTHVLILQKLFELQQKLDHMEERLIAVETVEKLDQWMKWSEQLPGLMAITGDVLDEEMKKVVAAGLHPEDIGEVIGQVMQAVSQAKREPTRKVGAFWGLIRAIRDPDRQRALSFMLNFLKNFGRRLS